MHKACRRVAEYYATGLVGTRSRFVYSVQLYKSVCLPVMCHTCHGAITDVRRDTDTAPVETRRHIVIFYFFFLMYKEV